MLSRLQVRSEAEIQAEEAERQRRLGACNAVPACSSGVDMAQPPAQELPLPCRRMAPPRTFVRDGKKVGRNEPCPCGSGKKYKHCHGALGKLTSAAGSMLLGDPRDAGRPVQVRTSQGRVLIAQRPAGKHMAGRWEFPGGKLDRRGSALRSACVVSSRRNWASRSKQAEPLISYEHDYADRRRAARPVARYAVSGAAAVARRSGARLGAGSGSGEVDLLEADRPMVEALRAFAGSSRLPDSDALAGCSGDVCSSAESRSDGDAVASSGMACCSLRPGTQVNQFAALAAERTPGRHFDHSTGRLQVGHETIRLVTALCPVNACTQVQVVSRKGTFSED